MAVTVDAKYHLRFTFDCINGKDNFFLWEPFCDRKIYFKHTIIIAVHRLMFKPLKGCIQHNCMNVHVEPFTKCITEKPAQSYLKWIWCGRFWEQKIKNSILKFSVLFAYQNQTGFFFLDYKLLRCKNVALIKWHNKRVWTFNLYFWFIISETKTISIYNFRRNSANVNQILQKSTMINWNNRPELDFLESVCVRERVAYKPSSKFSMSA